MPNRVQEAHEIRRELLELAERVMVLAEEEGAEPSALLSSSPGERFVEARSRLGLSQADVSEQSGVSVNAIVKFEKGHTNPRMKTLMALADTVQLPWESLRAEGT